MRALLAAKNFTIGVMNGSMGLMHFAPINAPRAGYGVL